MNHHLREFLPDSGIIPDVGDLQVRRVCVGLSLLGCASQLSSTVAGRAYDTIRRSVGFLRRTVNEIAQHYGFQVDAIEVAVTPVSVIASSLRTHELAELARALDAAATDTDVDTLRGFATMAPMVSKSGFASVAEAIPVAVASTKRMAASLHWGSPSEDLDFGTIREYARILESLSRMPSATNELFLRLSCGPTCADTLSYHHVYGPEVAVNVEVSCLRQLLSAVSGCAHGELTVELSAELERLGFWCARAARFLQDKIVAALSMHTGSDASPGRVLVTGRLAGAPDERDVLADAVREIASAHGSSALLTLASAAISRGSRTAIQFASPAKNLPRRIDGIEFASKMSVGDLGTVVALPAQFSADVTARMIRDIAVAEAGSAESVSVIVVDALPHEKVAIGGHGTLPVAGVSPDVGLQPQRRVGLQDSHSS